MQNKVSKKWLRRTSALILTLFVMTLSAFAQKTITGTVVDSNGEAVIGANVIVKGASTGAATDINGNFTIKNAPNDAVLRVSYVGYISSETATKGQNEVRIVLKEMENRLDEAVVIGYGSQRREAVTGSVVNISGDKLNQVPAMDVAQALQGRIAGVLMTQTSSQPGEEMQIRIRGQRSLTASNDPLIVLDGMPFLGNLSDINPNDIKAIDILKDASATAIYGSRGANGVIIITTKSGMTEQKTRITYDTYAGFKTVFSKYPMMNGEQFTKLRQYLATQGTGYSVNSIDEQDGVDTDWQDEFYRTGYTLSHNVNVSGGSKTGSYSFGGSYFKDQGVVPTQKYDRYTLNARLDQKVGDYFRFGLNSNTNFNEKNGGQVGLYNVLSMSPLVSLYDAAGNKRTIAHMAGDDQYIITRDVVESLEDTWLNRRRGMGSYNTVFAEVTCPWIEGLSYRINAGLNFRTNKTGSFTGTGVGSSNPDNPNTATVSQNQYRNWTVENLLTYDKTFAEKHHVNFTGLYSAERTTYERTYMEGKEIPAEYFQYYNIGRADGEIKVDPNSQDYWESGLMSWMGRIMYDYDRKYMASVALRSDGSSRLASGHQWHTYPAISAGWNIAREKFMEQFGDIIDNLKLRVGYGETSNQSISPYSTLGSLSTRPYNFGSSYATGYYVSQLPNTDLGWEYSKTWNFGLDFSLFHGRLSGTIEYYTQKTEDLLLGVSLPATSGVSSYTANVGDTENKGFEVAINGIILDNYNGWNWTAGINFYQNRNKLVSLASGADRDEANWWFVGHPIDVIYDYNKIGLWKTDEEDLRKILEPNGNAGMIKVEYTGEYDENGNPVRQINEDDRQIISMEPDLVGGFNTTVEYKNFDLTVIGAFQIGGKLISAIHSSNGYLNMLNGRRGQLDVDYWTEDNQDAKYPKPGGITSNDNPKYASTLGYFDAGYLKIRTITLGYSFSAMPAIKNLGISKLRVYATVQNPFVFFSPYKNECGLDPETNTYASNGSTTAVTYSQFTGSHAMPIVGYNTPATRSFIFGLNLAF